MIASLSNVVLLLELSTLVASSPFTFEKRALSSFKVERVPNVKFTGHNGPRELSKAYRKFNFTLPEGLEDVIEAQKTAKSKTKRSRLGKKWWSRPGGSDHEEGDGVFLGGGDFSGDHDGNSRSGSGNKGKGSANSSEESGAVTATPEDGGVEYLCPVTIGGQSLTLDFDTGSSDLWVFNSQLSAADLQGHSSFDPSKSSTFSVLQGATFMIEYGDGSAAAGDVGTDVVNVGGAIFDKQAVELAEEVSSSFISDTDSDGLMGLAFSTLNTVQPQQQKTFFDNIKSTLAEPLFTADLRNGAVGAYEFGTVDSSKFTGDLAWIPVDSSSGFWEFTSTKFAVGGGQPKTSTASGTAIADTGTTLLLADPSVVTGYYAQVQGAKMDQQEGGYVFPCSATLPDLEIDIGGVYMAKISGADINFSPVGGGSKSFSRPIGGSL